MPNVAMNGKTSNAKYITAEEGGTQVIFAGNQCPSQRRRWTFPWLEGWTKLEFFLTLLCVFLAVVVISLIIILTSRTPPTEDGAMNNGSPGRVFSNARTSESQKGCHPSGPTSQNAGGNICYTSGCVNAASRVLTSMDPSVKPCDNFYDFACGRWNKMNIIPDDKSFFNRFAKLTEDIQAALKILLDVPIDPANDTESTVKIKTLYASCMDEDELDKRALEPVKNLIAEFGGWPILESDEWWQRKQGTIDIIDLIVRLCHYDNKVLIDLYVASDDKSSVVNIIHFDQPELGMPSPEYFLQDELSTKISVYKKYAEDVAALFGANTTVAKRDVDAMVDFEIKLANIITPRDERRDNELLYNKMTIRKFAQTVPEFDWLTYLQKIFAIANITITDTEEIIVIAPAYFEKFGKLYQTADKRVVVNYLIWRILMNRVHNLPRQYRNIKNEFSKSMAGTSCESSRWVECVSTVNEYMGNAIGRLFVEQHFDEGSKTSALDMIHDIRNAFYDILDGVDWMDNQTKIVAKEKADAISELIGYPDYILNDTELNAEYADIDFSRTYYFQNVISVLKREALNNLKTLREPVDRSKWSTTPAIVNAFYSAPRNQIMFPAGMLQPPFYNKDFPKSLNYGGIGMVIGHEITHGFDDRGRQYNKNGILVQWWDNEVIKRFKERAQCIIDQYNNYTVPEVSMNINGKQTQGENIADDGGIKEAYKAFKKYLEKNSHEEPRLPGLEQYSPEQLFFINFAQIWCGVMRPEATITRIKTGVHSPGRFRVIGALQNFKDFSEVFNCPADSYMNKTHKCKMW